MERLTDTKRSRCVFCEATDEECAFVAGEFSAPCPDYRRYQRLADIEDILGDNYDLDRLKELMQADREGKCVVFPCKMGDTLYEISNNRIDDYTVIGLSVGDKSLSRYEDDTDCIDNNLYILADRHDKGCRMRVDIRAIGDEGAVYTKREEAEAALEKMKEDK